MAARDEGDAEADFARANALFDARHWPEAARSLRALLFDRPESTPAASAVRYLEALNVLGSEAARPECFDVMIADIGPLVARLCVGAAEISNRAECRILERVAFDIERLEAQRLVTKADYGPADRERLYAEVGARYLDLATRCVEATRRLAEPPIAWRCEEIAYNAARAFRAAGETDRELASKRLLLDPSNGMHQTPLARKLAGP